MCMVVDGLYLKVCVMVSVIVYGMMCDGVYDVCVMVCGEGRYDTL